MWSRIAKAVVTRRQFVSLFVACGFAASAAHGATRFPSGVPRCEGASLLEGSHELGSAATKKKKTSKAEEDEVPCERPPESQPLKTSLPAERPAAVPRREAPKQLSTIIYAESLHVHREIFVTGPITETMAKEVIAQLLYLERQQPGMPITLFINSGGGKVAAGMAMHDVMRNITSPVHTLCLGRCSSMAAVLLAAGERGERRAAPNCRVMVHQPRVKLSGSRKSRDLAIQQSQVEKSNVMTQRLLHEYTGLPMERVREMLEVDYYMTAQEALDCGLVDAIGGPIFQSPS